MALFPQPEENTEQDKIIAQLVHRLNDVDRRLRMVEQTMDNNKVNTNNLNENFVNHQKDTTGKLQAVQQKNAEIESRLGAVEAKLSQLLSEIRTMPPPKAGGGAEEPLQAAAAGEPVPEEVGSDLDSALSTLEKHTGTIEDELI